MNVILLVTKHTVKWDADRAILCYIIETLRHPWGERASAN